VLRAGVGGVPVRTERAWEREGNDGRGPRVNGGEGSGTDLNVEGDWPRTWGR